jgi:hypothetical protein
VRRLPTLALALLLNAGCGPAGETFYPVRGTVTIDGEPLTTGAVTLRAADGNPTRHHPTGEIGPDGRYELFTVGRPGAPPGRYRVLVMAHEPVDAPVEPTWLTHAKFRAEERTPLTIAVVEKPAPGAYDFVVSPPTH